MENVNNEPNKDDSAINPFIALLGVLLFFPLGIAFSLSMLSELLKTKTIFEWVYCVGFIYVVGIIPIEAGILLLKLILAKKDDRIIIKDSPRLVYFLRYYFSLFPAFLGFMAFSLFFLISFLRQFVKEGLPGSSWDLLILLALIFFLWKLFLFSFKWIIYLTGRIFLRDSKIK